PASSCWCPAAPACAGCSPWSSSRTWTPARTRCCWCSTSWWPWSPACCSATCCCRRARTSEPPVRAQKETPAPGPAFPRRGRLLAAGLLDHPLARALGGLGRGRGGCARDQELGHIAALGDIGRQPARLLAAAGPGFLRVFRVAVLRRHLAQLAGAAAAGRGAGAAAARGAEQLLDGVALGLGQFDQLAADLGDRGPLRQQGLALLGGGDQGTQFPGRQRTQINRHHILRQSWEARPWAIDCRIIQCNKPGNERCVKKKRPDYRRII